MGEKDLEKELFQKAEKITRKSKNTYWMARLFFEKSTKPYFYLWYAYLRWIDDIVDSADSKISKKEKLIFLEQQTNLAREIHDGVVKSEIRNEELFLISLDSKLLKTIFEVLMYANYDTRRRGIMQTEKRLNYYLEIEAESYVKIINYFCGSDDFLIGHHGSIGSEWSHILRDFRSDIETNIINISKEDMEKFRITNLSNTNNPNFKKWVKYKISFAKSQFVIAKNDFYRYPHSLHHKIAFEVLCAKYEFYINRIVKDDYCLRKDYMKPYDTAVFLFQALKAVLAAFLTHALKRS